MRKLTVTYFMAYTFTRPRKIALGLLTLWIVNILTPTTVYALTSGPTQPETKGFQPAGVTDMVDLQTGDFKYNIPLLDIDGYPINLNYQSGVSMDDEASWVGLGWSLNPGAINRQVRGVPDDMAGDEVVTEHYTKPKVTVGGRLRLKAELGGSETKSTTESNDNLNIVHNVISPSKSPVKVQGSFSIGIFSDSYTGIGAEIGVNSGITFGNDGVLTAGLGLGILSNTTSGVDLSPSANVSLQLFKYQNMTEKASQSASLGYNTRSGMKDFTLGTSFNAAGTKDTKTTDWYDCETNEHLGHSVDQKGGSGSSGYTVGGSSVSYSNEPVNPKITVPYSSTYGSFSFDIGGAAITLFSGGGGTGYKSVREVTNKEHRNPEYGLLYAERGKFDKNAIMDFIREKENPITPDLPNLALPVHTPDIFSYTSQTGGGQFKLYRGGTGAFFDAEAKDNSSTETLGLDIGIGSYIHGGVTWFDQEASNTTSKWTDNNYLKDGDFQNPSYTNPQAQHAFFKLVGEKTLEDADMTARFGGVQNVFIPISGIGTTTPNWLSGKITKQKRDIQRTVISYLTAGEAVAAGLDKVISYYNENKYIVNSNGVPVFTPPSDLKQVWNYHSRTAIPGLSTTSNKDHISEISVTDDQGKRMVYGIPVYNLEQDEYSFAISDPSVNTATPGYTVLNNNQVQTTSANGAGKGIDNYYHHEHQPGYAASFLLTTILSPDYVDKTGDGVTDDDLGTAIQFHYSKGPNIKWRTPYQNATVNKCLLADKDDDKASIVYGEKETYYVHSIESKTKIAFFITDDRCDALGVTGLFGGKDASKRQKRLIEIRLYSKADYSKPIKAVKFKYSYQLCPGVPNFEPDANNPTAGKLTLTEVYFEYGNTKKGENHPYKFTYTTDAVAQTVLRDQTDFLNAGKTDNVSHNAPYNTLSTDRWGVYKPNVVSKPNDEYPYTLQDMPGSTTNKDNADLYASMWHLRQISLPTGGIIGINYESDDYAYVQDKRADVMVPATMCTTVEDPITHIKSYPALTASTDSYGRAIIPNLQDMSGFNIPFDPAYVTDAASFIRYYLNGSKYIYSKMAVKMATSNSQETPLAEYDYVPCFSSIDIEHLVIDNNTHIAHVILQTRSQDSRWGRWLGATVRNPVVFAAWQRMKEDYPRYCYPGFDRRANSGTAEQSFVSAVRAICSAFGNMDELTENLYQKAERLHYGNSVDANKCFIRLAKVDGKKLGGGVRVKKIMISDEWSGGSHLYGQAYDYTTTEDKHIISSGVAAYEPAVGSDENALKEPVNYQQGTKGAISNYFDIETPFGESFYPAPSVVYSKVKITDIVVNSTGDAVPDTDLKTGYTVKEFYTAKDFPVRVSVSDLKRRDPTQHNAYFSLNTWSVINLCMSQGYAIELNDMHGKPRAERVFNKYGAEISSAVYYYNADKVGDKFKLKNTVSIVKSDGTVTAPDQVIGRDVEFFTDFREQYTINDGNTLNLGADIVPPFGIPIPHWPVGDNKEYKRFRSVCAVKLSQYYGIIDSVVKTQNGSSVTTQNIAYDEVTGDPVITKTKNEFKKDIYSVNIPANWAYNRMGGAYQNSGALISGLTTTSTGEIASTNPLYKYFASGDEFIDLHDTSGGNHYWVVEEMIDNSTHQPAYAPGTTGYLPSNGSVGYTKVKYIIDRSGKMKKSIAFGLIKVVRSGYRNILGAGLTSIVCLNNPIIMDNGITHLRIAQTALNQNATADITDLKVINASASTYDENWSVEQPDYQMIEDKTHEWQLYKPSSASLSYLSYTADCYDDNGISSSNSTQGGGKIYDNRFLDSYYSYGLYPPYPSTPNGRQDYSYKFAFDGVFPLPDNSSNGYIAPQTIDVYGFYTTFTLNNSRHNNSGDFYLGYESNIAMRIFIDNVCVTDPSVPDYFDYTQFPKSHWGWRLTPINLNPNTTHTLKVELLKYSINSLSNRSNVVALQILDNTKEDLDGVNGVPNLVRFSLKDLLGSTNLQAYYTSNNNTYYHYYYTDPAHTPVLPCFDPPTTINPFIYGFKGNWRPYKSKVFQQNRLYNNLTGGSPNVNVKNAGYIDKFYTNWYSLGDGTPWVENTAIGANRWTIANTVTVYDKFGQQLENKDALNRYSAAIFSFKGELPAAVASNARNREIYYGSYEDNNLVPNLTSGIAQQRDFYPSFNYYVITANLGHSGKTSISLPPSGVTLATQVYTTEQKTVQFLSFDSNNQFIKTQPNLQDVTHTLGLYPNGFEPVPRQQYIFSAWVKDHDPYLKSVNNSLTLSINGTHVNGSAINSAPILLKVKAIVEGWKLVEGTIDLGAYANGDKLNISIVPGATTDPYPNIYIDDIRIHPKDSHMKTYAYDYSNLRLMAEMDENNFATFYEYDSEGLLIRVKKETERGIMTLKESRSSYKKQP